MQDTAAAALQERKDAKWWLGTGGQATLNGTKNRDVETFWQQAAEAHVNVRSNLKQASTQKEVLRSTIYLHTMTCTVPHVEHTTSDDGADTYRQRK